MRHSAELLSLGFTRTLERTSIVNSHPFGLSGYIVPSAALPDVLRPDVAGARDADAASFRAVPDRPLEWLLALAGVQRVVSHLLPAAAPATRFWIGLSDGAALTPDQAGRVAANAAESAAVLHEAAAADDSWAAAAARSGGRAAAGAAARARRPRGLRRARVDEILTGTLAVDLIDAASRTIIWRAMATKEIDQDAKPEKREKNITAAVTKLFRNYPPK